MDFPGTQIDANHCAPPGNSQNLPFVIPNDCNSDFINKTGTVYIFNCPCLLNTDTFSARYAVRTCYLKLLHQPRHFDDLLHMREKTLYSAKRQLLSTRINYYVYIICSCICLMTLSNVITQFDNNSKTRRMCRGYVTHNGQDQETKTTPSQAFKNRLHCRHVSCGNTVNTSAI